MRALLPVLCLLVGCAAAPHEVQTPDSVSPCHATATKNAPPPSPSSSTELPSTLENLPIVSVIAKGNTVLTSTKVLATSGLTSGTPFHRAAIAKAIVALYRTGEIDDVQIQASNDEHGVTVEILVRERPFVIGIYAPGLDPKQRDAAAEALGLSERRRFDAAELYLRSHGDGAPAVDWEIVPGRNNSVSVCLYPRTK